MRHLFLQPSKLKRISVLILTANDLKFSVCETTLGAELCDVMSFLYELENTLYDNVDKATEAGLVLPDKLGKY